MSAPESKSEYGDVDAQQMQQDRVSAELCSSVSLCYTPPHFSHVQMWMCDEINVAQVKRAGRGTAPPHSSLSAHMQILKFVLN